MRLPTYPGRRVSVSAMLLFLYLPATILLFLGFAQNRWKVVEDAHFRSFRLYDDSMVLARMVEVRQNGFAADGWLVGRGAAGTIDPWGDQGIALQYDAYLNGTRFRSFSPYCSLVGLQATGFALLDQVIPASPARRLLLFTFLSAGLTALALVLILAWFRRRFGVLVFLVLLLAILLSPWLTIYAPSLFMATWAFYLLLAAPLYLLEHAAATGRYRSRLTAAAIFLAMLVKCLFNGYEFIATVLIMLLVPFVYYAVAQGWRLRDTLWRMVVAAASACLAVLVSFVVLCYQIAAVRGTFADGIAHIVVSFGKRAHGNPTGYGEIYTDSLRADTLPVVWDYVQMRAFGLSDYRHVGVRFGHLILLFLLFTLLFLILNRRRPGDPARRKRTLALIAATWFSLLAPLAWFVVFTAHSYLHMHMDAIVWHMPFTLFGFALCGVVSLELWRAATVRNRVRGRCR